MEASHRSHIYDREGRQSHLRNPVFQSTRPTATVPQAAQTHVFTSNRPPLTRERLSTSSSVSGGHPSTESGEEFSTNNGRRVRLSAIPRSTNTQSGSRLDTLSLSKPVQNSTTLGQPKSRGSGSLHEIQDVKVSTQQTLRRKHPSITATSSKFSKELVSSPKISFDTETDSILATTMSDRNRSERPSVTLSNMYARSQQITDLPPGLIPELQALATAHAREPFSQSQSMSSISSPSTQYTESPGPWSSRNTTPMSISSYSPSIVQPLRINKSGKRANTVPIPTTSRQRAPSLPVLRETLTSSSSSAKSKDYVGQDAKQEVATPKKKKRKPLEDDAAPTPPPRSSSAKRNETVGEVIDSGIGYSNPNAARREQDLNSVENSPLAKRSSRTFNAVGDSLPRQIVPTTREEAAAFEKKPTRPSRSQIISLEPRKTLHLRNDMKKFNPQSKKGDDLIQRQRSQQPVPESPPKNFFSTQSRLGEKPTRLPLKTIIHSQPPPAYSQAGKPAPKMYTPAGLLNPIDPVATGKKMGKLSRLGAFMRGKKIDDSSLTTSSRKLQRKGPAAGTGHEGYGKHAKHSKKRSLSSTTIASERSTSSFEKEASHDEGRKMSSSTRRESKTRTSQSDLEEFVGSRLQPVIMMGGSKKGESRVQNTSSASKVDARPSTASEHVARPSQDFFLEQRPNTAGGPVNRAGDFFHKAVSSQSSILSQHQWSPETRTLPNAATTVADHVGLPFLRRTRTPQSSVSASENSIPAFERPIQVRDEPLLQKPDKKARKLKWNFFSRNSSANKISTPTPLLAETARDLPVRISAIPVARSVPYYAMLESESDNNISDLGEFMEQVVHSPPPRIYEDQRMRPHPQTHRTPSVLLPSLPFFPPESSQLTPPTPTPVQERKEVIVAAAAPTTDRTSADKPRRLAPVGRIPKVMSRKDRRHTPNAHSFSRPFQAPFAATDVDSTQSISLEPERPALEIHTDILPSRPFYEVDNSKPASAPAQMLSDSRDFGISLRQEFFAPLQRQDSQISVSTSSEGMMSLAAPTHVLNHIMQTPSSRFHGEDEVWNEYDDFLDHVMSPSKSKGKGAQLGQTTPTESSSPPLLQNYQEPSYDDMIFDDEFPATTTQTPTILFPPTLLEPRLSGDVRLRRSRIVSALHSSIDLSSPFSVARFFAGYGDGDKTSSERLSTVSTEGTSGLLAPNAYIQPNRISSSENSTNQPEVVLFDVVEKKETDPAADSELHFASLMISRWLSFGRVLFSPAQTEVLNQPDRHVLIIDGLRNEDFSYYCCVTFKRAYVHSLKELEPRPTRRRIASAETLGHAPPNYRNAEVASFGDRFPFPPTFFSAVVLRFLPAMSDHKLQNIIGEAKRVLAPGGHLELMLLDLDMVNMGTQTRRAVRELKIRMANADPGISLKPISDNIQGILGRKGFANLNRCVVGVPVAGKIAGSMDSSSSSRSSGQSFAQGQGRRSSNGSQRQLATKPPSQHHRHHHIGENFSLNDLISDHTPGSDEKIAKIVSKTARFWFSHCYEPALQVQSQSTGQRQGGKSILTDRKVLHECKLRTSSFKLLIAHTQKPEEVKRRTVSEPSLPTLASTAGGFGSARAMKNITL